MANLVKHIGPFLSAALPVIVALEAVPGNLGKAAALIAAGLSAVLNRKAQPK